MRRFVPITLLLLPLTGCASDSTGERTSLNTWISHPFGQTAAPTRRDSPS